MPIDTGRYATGHHKRYMQKMSQKIIAFPFLHRSQLIFPACVA
jgi:hypothetical protein